MGRGGVAPPELLEVASLLDQLSGARLSGVWSHLAAGSDRAAAANQARAFEAALAALAADGRPLPPAHLAASEGLLCATVPEYDMVRIGLAYYGELGVGVEPAVEMAALAARLRPAMTVACRAVRVEWVAPGATVGYGSEWVAARRSLIATLPIGYADGWVRAYWPGSEALFRGRRVPLVGRVSMDSVCADVTDTTEGGEVRHEETFVMLGAQADERITAAELAVRRNTITNEILCSFGPRLPRVHVRSNQPPG
jgi:alanine racemase